MRELTKHTVLYKEHMVSSREVDSGSANMLVDIFVCTGSYARGRPNTDLGTDVHSKDSSRMNDGHGWFVPQRPVGPVPGRSDVGSHDMMLCRPFHNTSSARRIVLCRHDPRGFESTP